MMKRKNIVHVFVAALLCVMLILTNVTLPGTTTTAQAAGKNISSLSISGIATKEYTGSVVTQQPVIKDGTKTLTKGADYTLSYKNNYEVGKATVTMKGKGNYTGSVSKSFHIIPAKVQLLKAKSVIAGTAELTWEFGREVDGYQVYYATSKAGKYKKLATVNTNLYKAELTGGKTYYIKVRAFAKEGGKTYYGKYTEAVKVTVLMVQSKIKIIDSGKAYGNYIKISDISEEIIKQMKFVYTEGIFTRLTVQYLDKDTNSGRWVNFFEEISEDNNPVMGKNEYIGMFLFEILSKDSLDTVQPYYEAMNPDERSEWYSNDMKNPVLNYNRAGGSGIYSLTLSKNPAVDSDRNWIQEYLDMKEDGYIMMISGACEWIPN